MAGMAGPNGNAKSLNRLSAGSVYIVNNEQPPLNREPDSGISSARSTGTVPWSHNEVGLPALQPVNPAAAGHSESRLEEYQL